MPQLPLRKNKLTPNIFSFSLSLPPKHTGGFFIDLFFVIFVKSVNLWYGFFMKFVSASKAARLLGLTTPTVIRHIKNGLFQGAYHIGDAYRIPVESIEMAKEYIQGKKEKTNDGSGSGSGDGDADGAK